MMRRVKVSGSDFARSGLTRRELLRGAAAGGVALGAGLLGGGGAAWAAPRRQTRGGTLTVALPFDFPSFDPFQLLFQNYMMVQSFYDTLIRYDKARNPLPGLAAEWTIAPDGTAVDLKLR